MIKGDFSRKTNSEGGQRCQLPVPDSVMCLAVMIKGGIRIQLESWLREHYNCDIQLLTLPSLLFLSGFTSI